MRFLCSLFLLSGFACAQDAAPAPEVSEMEHDDFDLVSLKSGEWSLEEAVSEVPGKEGTFQKTVRRTRRACVKADKDRVWIETSTWDAEAKGPDAVLLCEVDRKTRKVLKAWRSEKGAKGKEVAVKPGPRPAVVSQDGQGSFSDVDESRPIGAKQIKCTGMNIQKIKWSSAKGNEPAPRFTLVFSTEAPFRLRLDDAEVCSRHQIHAKRPAGTLVGNMALVELSVDDNANGRESRKLVDFGADAKPAVKIR